MEMRSLGVVNPTLDGLDCCVTETLAVREAGRTAQEASSGRSPDGLARTRRASSRRAVIRITADSERISMPFSRAREFVTRSSRTKAGPCRAWAVVFVWGAEARSRNPNETNKRRATFCTQHLMGAKL